MLSAIWGLLRRQRGRVDSDAHRRDSRSLKIEPLEGRRLLAQTTGVFVNTDEAYDGFTLFNPMNVNTTFLIDNEGDVIHRWESDFTPGLMNYLLPDGSLLRAGKPVDGWDSQIDAAGGGGRLEWKTWDGELIWDFSYDTDEHLSHHDIEPIFNTDGSLGSVIMIAWEYRTEAEAEQAGRDPSLRGDDSGEMYPDSLVEVKPVLNPEAGQPDYEIIWEWHVWDHLIQDYDDDISKDNFGVVAENPQLVDINKISDGEGRGAIRTIDWTHANGVSYNPDLDILVLSLRKFSEFWVIDHGTTTAEAASHEGGNFGMGGDLLYRWGQPDRYDTGSAADRTMFYQHDPTWVLGPDTDSTDDDTILILDNGWGRPEDDFTATLEIPVPELVMNPESGAKYGFVFEDNTYYGPIPENYETIYKGEFPRYFAAVISGAQRLPNGNTLTTLGTSGTFVEVNGEGEVVWEYVNRWLPDGPLASTTPIPPREGSPVGTNAVFKVRRYGEDYFDFAANDDFNLDDLYPDHHDTIGLVNPEDWRWFLADHVGGSTDGNTVVARGAKLPATWVPLTGDWDGDGRDSVGLYNPKRNKWILFGDTQDNGKPEEKAQVIVGPRPHPSWIPATGDWDADGSDSPALYDPVNGRWWLNNRSTTVGPDDFITFVVDVKPARSFQPVAGDWDGDGIDTVGFYNRITKAWRLYNNYNDASGQFGDATNANREAFRTTGFGTRPRPITGDWDGDGSDSVGLYDASNNNWYFNNRNEQAGVNDVDTYQTPPAPGSWLPVTGNWDGSSNQLMIDARTALAATPGTAATLDQRQVSAALDAAVASLSESGLAVPWLDEIAVGIVDLGGRQLARALGKSAIQLDVDAAGAGWWIDTTPRDDSEFPIAGADREWRAQPGTAADEGVDLLTVLLHELGHLSGAQHATDGVMRGTLGAGMRRGF